MNYPSRQTNEQRIESLSGPHSSQSLTLNLVYPLQVSAVVYFLTPFFLPYLHLNIALEGQEPYRLFTRKHWHLWILDKRELNG